MRLHFILLVLLGLFLAAAPRPSLAGAIDAAGADKVRASVEEALTAFTTEQSLKGKGLQAGSVTVTPKGDHYAVTIPDLTLRGSGGTVLRADAVRLRIVPQEGTPFYETAVFLPTILRMTDSAGLLRMEISLGQTDISGLWHHNLHTFTTLKARFDGLRATLPPPPEDSDRKAGALQATIGRLDVSIDMKPDGSTWSGTQATEARDIRIRLGGSAASPEAAEKTAEKKGDALLTIDRFVNSAVYAQQDLAARRESRRQLQTLAANDTPEALAAFIRDLRQESIVPGGIENRFVLEGVRYAADGPLALALQSLEQTSNLQNLHSDKAEGNSLVTFSGLSVAGLEKAPLFARLIPQEGRLRVSTRNLPADALFAYLQGALPGLAQVEEGEAREVYTEQIIQGLPQHLARSGLQIDIDDSFVKAPGLGLFLEGALEARENIPHLFAGRIKISLSGMEELIRDLQQSARADNNPQAAGLAQLLIILQLSAQAEAAADGAAHRSYTIDLKDDGRILLNNTDIEGLGALPQ